MSRKRPQGVVYSTNPDYLYQYDEEPTVSTLEPARQRLRVAIERKGRGGKTATVVRGFVGSEDDLSELGRQLKSRLGVGGTAKDGEIVIQGELKDKTIALLQTFGFTDTK